MVGILCGKLLLFYSVDTPHSAIWERQEIRIRCILKYDSPLMTVSYSLLIYPGLTVEQREPKVMPG